MQNRNALLIVIALAAGMAALFSCGKSDTVKPDQSPPAVTVIQPVKQAVTDYLEFTGNAQASDTVQLEARVAGYLTKVEFNDGDIVKNGQLLFEIEPEQYAANVRLSEAAVEGARAELDRSNLEYARQAELVKKNAVAVSEVEKWRAQRDLAQATLDQRKAQLEVAKIQFSYTQIKAPFEGRVDRRLKDPGNLVGMGEATPLTTIYRTNPIYVYFSINEKDLVRVRKAKTGHEQPVFAQIEGEKDYPLKGRLDYASTTLDPGTGTLQLRALFDNPMVAMMPKVLPGMFVRVRTPVNERPEAILVPDRAVGLDQGGRFVLVVGADGVVGRKSIKTGQMLEKLRVIDTGLNGDEQVIVGGIQQARPGSKVKAVMARTDEVLSNES